MVHRFLKFTLDYKFINVFKRFTDTSAIRLRIRIRGFAATPLSKAVPDFFVGMCQLRSFAGHRRLCCKSSKLSDGYFSLC